MSTKVGLAKALAKHFHAGQKYGDKDYYAFHLVGVATYAYLSYDNNTMPFTLENASCVAYLHDSIEDTNLVFDDLYHLLDDEVAYAVHAMTVSTAYEQTRKEYLEQVSLNPLATFVKICDAEFNRDRCLVDGDEKRAKYYQDTINYLKGEIK